MFFLFLSRMHFHINSTLIGRAVAHSSIEWEVRGSNLGPLKSDTVLLTARHRCDISSKGAVLPGRSDAEMSPANSLHASAYYSKYNETFDLLAGKFHSVLKYNRTIRWITALLVQTFNTQHDLTLNRSLKP